MKKNGAGSEILSAPSRISMALKNASVIARFGRLEPRTGTVYYVANESSDYRLRCYETKKSPTKRTPIILVPPLMISADVYDMTHDGSAVSYLTEQGYSVWVVDFGAPENQEGGLERDFSDHILAVNDAINHVVAESGLPVHLGGYSQGGIFCYLATAYRGSKNIASIVTFGSPVNIYKNFLPGVPDEVTTKLFETIGSVFPKSLTPSVIPASVTKNLFKLMSPTKEVKRWISFLGSLHDRDALLQTEEGRSFLGGEGFVAWPGPALHEFLRQMLMGNRLVSGGCVIEGRAISLTEITCPILAVIGSNDEIARGGSVRGIADAVPNAELFELPVTGGHMGIVVGSGAMKNTWPSVSEWVRWQTGKGAQPQNISVLGENLEIGKVAESRNDALPIAALKSVFGIGKGFIGTTADLLGITTDSLQAITKNFSSHISTLNRLENLNSESEVGIALALAEQAQKAPTDTYFLYDGRAHSYSDASKRVDNIARGLISLGIRTGDHVGILMHARPSSLATIIAINRLGAVAVLLRNERTSRQLKIELKLGSVQYLIADPENASEALEGYSGQVYVLGGFGRSQRDLPVSVVDMEKIDPARVPLPDWYRPSPGKADDLAFILFAGHDVDTHCNHISNRRWALSALGTASSAAMMSSDTVYCWTPLHDPSGLLVSVSASLVAGARAAVAREFDVDTFWKEIRSYGAQIVCYSGCMLRTLVDAPEHKLEKGNPLRIFVGLGMPEPLSKRVLDRFKSIKAMEIYASTDSNAYLANVTCKKVGPVVQPIPGSSEVTLVHWDYEKDQAYYDAAGYLCPAPTGTVGMMLCQADTGIGYQDNRTIFNAFKKGDCWQVTGDLFIIEDDEYRFVDKAENLIRSKEERLPTLPIENVVWQLESISVAAAYGLAIEGYDYEVPAVAVLLRKKARFSPGALAELVTQQLDKRNRPVVIRIMAELPMTLGQQVQKQALRNQGLPDIALQKGRSYWFNEKRRKYEPLNQISLEKLSKSLVGKSKPAKKPTKKILNTTASSSKGEPATTKQTAPKRKIKIARKPGTTNGANGSATREAVRLNKIKPQNAPRPQPASAERLTPTSETTHLDAAGVGALTRSPLAPKRDASPPLAKYND